MQYLFSFVAIIAYQISFSQAKYDLKLNLNVGDTYAIVSDVKSVTTQDVMGEVQIIKKHNSYSYDYEVVKKPDNSSYYIKVLFKRFFTSFEVDNEVVSFDSDSTFDNENSLNKLYNYIIDKAVFLSVNNRGFVMSIDSLDEISERFKNEVSTNEADISVFFDLFGEESIKNLTEFTVFPEKPIAQNESWVDHNLKKTGVLHISNSTLNITNVDSKSYVIKRKSDMASDNTKTISRNKIFLNYMLIGSEEKDDFIDRKTGMVLHSETSQLADGNVSMKYNENSDPAYSWPIIISQTISLKAIKIH